MTYVFRAIDLQNEETHHPEDQRPRGLPNRTHNPKSTHPYEKECRKKRSISKNVIHQCGEKQGSLQQRHGADVVGVSGLAPVTPPTPRTGLRAGDGSRNSGSSKRRREAENGER